MHDREYERLRPVQETRLHYSAGLITWLLVALVAIVALMLFTAAPVFTH